MIILKLNNKVILKFSDGNTITLEDVSSEDWKFIVENQFDETALYHKFTDSNEIDEIKLLKKAMNSEILTVRGNSVYMLDVSELTLPSDLVAKIITAEESGDIAAINKYKNFWTLVSMNPDSRVRNNLFWFIRKWDMQITESGLIRAYRNVDIKSRASYSIEVVKDIINSYYQEKYINKNNPDTLKVQLGKDNISLTEAYNRIINRHEEVPVFTDCHTHTFTIKLGEPVRMSREEVDDNQEHSCSQGLHLGAKSWLKQGYYGEVGLECLVNPANVVAVPTIDDYGKMRVCEYFPIAIIDFDENGDIIETSYTVHDDIEYLKQLKYEGEINNEDADLYTLTHTHISREEYYSNILNSLHENK